MPAKTRKIDAMRRIQELLQDAVTNRNLTVAQIAENADLEPSLVYKYLRGDRPGMALTTFLALVDAVGKHPSDVFGERKKAERAPERILSMHEEIGRYLKGKP